MAAHFSSTVGPQRLFLVILVLAASLSIVGCQQEGEGPGHREQPLALTPQEEWQLGRQAYDEILRNAEVLTGGPEVDQVYRVSRRVAQALRIEPLQQEINLHLSGYRFDWQYSVIASDQINAFCLPGGKIGVFTGLLKVVRNDDQLAAVIAHEIAHALAHHTSERNARAQESEADHIGLFLMTFAGYDPDEAVVFWKEMQAVAERGARPPEILSDDPSDARRIRQLEAWVPMVKAAKRAYDEGRIAPPREGRKTRIP